MLLGDWRLSILFALLAQSGAGESLERFRATYVGNYQQLLDDNCEGPPPVIQLFCQGNIKPIKWSDPSIDCDRVKDDNGWDGVQCVNKCSEEGQPQKRKQCEEKVYMVRNGKSEGGVFAEIEFQCTGASPDDVRAYMSYMKGEEGKCKLGYPKSRNYHVGKLGVQCITDSGNAFYEYGMDHFNCKGGVFAQFGKNYACYTGDNCNGRPCRVNFDNIVIRSNNQNVRLNSTCMDHIVEVPETSPQTRPSPEELIVQYDDQPSAIPTTAEPTLITSSPTTLTPTNTPTNEPTGMPTTTATTRTPTMEPTIASTIREPTILDADYTAPPSLEIASTTINNSPTISPTTTTNTSTAAYSARYMGRFHQVLSPGCAANKPRLMAVCNGDVEITDTSHPSIQCFNYTFRLDDGRRGMYCENKCVGFECDMVYYSEEYHGNQGSPAFGQIYFTCSGDNITDVDGSFLVAEDEPSFCDGSDEEGRSQTIAQLAVVCPTDDGLRYIIDDRHSECGKDNDAIRYGTYYSCSAGGTCGDDDEKCQIDMKNLEVNADPHLFQECIEAADNSVPVPVFPSPTKPEREAGIYTTRFLVGWLTIMDSKCEKTLMTRRIHCTNGRIKIIESDPIDCTYADESTVDCVATDPEQGQLKYECTADSELPETKAEFFSDITSCTEHTTDLIAWPALQLGIICGEDETVISDWFFECGGEGAEFDVESDGTPFCYAAIPVPKTIDRNIPLAEANFTGKLEIMTDSRWSYSASQQCYQYYAGRRQLRGS